MTDDAHMNVFHRALARLDDELIDLGVEVGDSARVDDRCRQMLKGLRERCPGLVPEFDLPAGSVGDAIPVPVRNATALVVAALCQASATAATGTVPLPDAPLPSNVLWQEGTDALLVEVAQARVVLTDGVVRVTLPVRCDQLPTRRGTVTVTLVVGTVDRPTGLFVASPDHPEGPPVVVQRWGEALTAFVWQAVVDVVSGLATHAGRDVDGACLVPVALVAARNGLVVLPQARHPIDRLTTSVTR